MQKTTSELSTLVDGTLFGNPDTLISDAKPFAEAGPGEITFWDDLTWWKSAETCQASAIMFPNPACHSVKTDFSPDTLKIPVILVADIHRAFTETVKLFRPPAERPNFGVHPRAILGENVSLGKNVTIFPGAVIGDNVEIGDDTIIFPNVTIYENCVVGKNCVLHAGAVIGAYGFGYSLQDGKHILSAQFGNVILEDRVEIGANTTIDRGTYGATTIGEGTKIDNLVMIGHNCRIGRHNLLCSQVGIAGSTTTGDYVVMAGQVGVRDHVEIGSRVTLGAQAGVAGSILEEGIYLGAPAISIQEMKRQVVAIKQLPEHWKTIKKMVKKFEENE